MSTTDNSIPLDLKFFDELYDHRYPQSTAEDRAMRRKMCEDGEIQIETMLENAICLAGGLTKDSVDHRDFTDGSDAKKVVSQYRRKTKGDANGYLIPKVTNKTGTLRIMAWNKLAGRFDYFVIPNKAYRHTSTLEITLCIYSGDTGYGQYRKYQVKNFKEMATFTGNEVDEREKKEWEEIAAGREANRRKYYPTSAEQLEDKQEAQKQTFLKVIKDYGFTEEDAILLYDKHFKLEPVLECFEAI